MCLIPPLPGTHRFEFSPKTKSHFLLEKNISLISEYDMNLEDCTSSKELPYFFDIIVQNSENRPSGAHYYFCFNLSLIESYLEDQYTPV